MKTRLTYVADIEFREVAATVWAFSLLSLSLSAHWARHHLSYVGTDLAIDASDLEPTHV